MKQKVVVQLEYGCRVLVNPDPSEYSHLPHVVNPNLALVRGLSPEDWKIVGGLVTAENPSLLPPVESRSYEAVQEDFLNLRCEIDSQLRQSKAEIEELHERYRKSLANLRICVAVVSTLLSAAVVYLVVTHA